MKLREIASRLDCELSGGGEIEITGVAGMEHAYQPEIDAETELMDLAEARWKEWLRRRNVP